MITNGYPLSGGNSIFYYKDSTLERKERTNRVNDQINFKNEIPLLYKVDLIVKDLLLEYSWGRAKECELYKLPIVLIN